MFWGLIILKDQRTIVAINILQKEIETAPTPVRALPIIGDVLTEKRANKSNNVVEIIEVQCGDYLGEDDIVRFEDNYGRIESNET